MLDSNYIRSKRTWARLGPIPSLAWVDHNNLSYLLFIESSPCLWLEYLCVIIWESCGILFDISTILNVPYLSNWAIIVKVKNLVAYYLVSSLYKCSQLVHLGNHSYNGSILLTHWVQPNMWHDILPAHP